MRNIILFSLLMLVGLGACEYYARKQPCVYSLKKDYIEQRGDSIETLFVGASLTYWGIAPDEWPEGHAFNFAFNGQLIDMEYHVLKRWLHVMPNLRRIILEVSYCLFFDPPFEETEHWDRIVPYIVHLETGHHSDYSRYGFEISSPPVFRQKILPWAEAPLESCDSTGHATYRGIEVRSESWESSINWIVPVHTIDDWKYVSENYEYFAMILDLCKDAGLEVIVVFPPAHYSYRAAIDRRQLYKTYEMVMSLQSRYGFRFLDYFGDTRFGDDDFFDAVHLSSDVGARKFTGILYEDVMLGGRE